MGSRKRDFFEFLNHVAMDGMERDKRKAAQQGPMPRYFARLDAAEALCLWFEATYLPGSGGDELLAAWRKAKAASEAPQGEGGEGC